MASKNLGREKELDAFGIDNPIMDILIKVDDEFLNKLGLKKGAMTLVDEQQLEKYEEQIGKHESFEKRVMIPGGSASNTMAGIVTLGGSAAFCGKIGDDANGKAYEEKLRKHGVKSSLVKTAGRTGVAIALITPDSERTFIVHLGVANKLSYGEAKEHDISSSSFIHVSGYLIDNTMTRRAAIEAMEYAKKHNVKVSMDLSDYNLAKKNKELIDALIKNYVDILFANELEAEAFTGKKPEQAAIELGQKIKTAVVKLGAEGSLIMHEGKLHKIKGFKANAVDTTGAGDMYAAGILYGLSQGWPIERAGKIASYAAAKVVEVIGARLDKSLADEVKKL